MLIRTRLRPCYHCYLFFGLRGLRLRFDASRDFTVTRSFSWGLGIFLQDTQAHGVVCPGYYRYLTATHS